MKIKKEELKKYYSESGFRQEEFYPEIGHHTEYCFKQLVGEKMDETNTYKQLAKAYEIMSCCNPEYSIDRTQGLVLGKVQSGKTSNFSFLSALAADNKYSIVIQLLGDKTNLVDDNFESVSSNLGLLDKHADLNWYKPIKVQGKMNDFSVGQLAKLINSQETSWDDEDSNKILYFYLIKNTNQINKLTSIIEELTKKVTKSCQTLIIDDEVDSYSLNTKKIGQNPGPTYSALEKLKKACIGCTYVGYTATSQGIYLAHDDSFLRPEFYAVLDPGDGYIGNFELFGKAEPLLSNKTKKIGLNSRHQPVIFDPMDYTNLNRKGKPTTYDPKKVDKYLREAIVDFLVSLVFCRERGIKKPMSMMIYPHNTNDPQRGIKRNLESALRDLRAFLVSNSNGGEWDNFFTKVYDKKIKHLPRDKSSPSLDKTKSKIQELLDAYANSQKSYEIKLLNQQNPGEINPDDEHAWFLIGGLKLSRGYVVPDLLTTFMLYQANNLTMDTTEQRGRFFGYKKEYSDLISIYCQEETFNLFKNYTSIEEYFFEACKLGAKDGTDFNHVDTNNRLFNLAFFGSKHKPTSASKNRTKKMTLKSSSWATSLYSSFINDGKSDLEHNHEFRKSIKTFLDNFPMKKMPKNNKFHARHGTGQEFKYNRVELKFAYDTLLKKVEPHISDQDKTLRALIQAIGAAYYEEEHECDIIFFSDINSRALSENSSPSVGWSFPASGYSSGARMSGRSKGFVGVNRVIFGEGFNPRLKPFDKENNTTFTIQIHKIKNITKMKDGPTMLDDSYQIRIHAPWDHKTNYFLSA